MIIFRARRKKYAFPSLKGIFICQQSKTRNILKQLRVLLTSLYSTLLSFSPPAQPPDGLKSCRSTPSDFLQAKTAFIQYLCLVFFERSAYF